jgi:hypothetical protein
MTRRVAIYLICWLGSSPAQDGPFRVQTKIVRYPSASRTGMDGILTA